VAYEYERKAKIAAKSATLRHDVLSIAREASAAGRLRPNAETGKVESAKDLTGNLTTQELANQLRIVHRRKRDL